MTRIGIVVTHPSNYGKADPDQDSRPLAAELLSRGVQAEPVIWHDESVDWGAYDLLVIRSPWDYSVRLAEFTAWLANAERVSTVLNEPALIRWNLDKIYLDQLASFGVAVVPTTYRSSVDEVRADLAGYVAADPESHVVLKPAISAGAHHTGLFRADDPEALLLAEQILADGGTVMVQPEVPELSEGAEKALYLIDGHFSHAIAKGALLERGGGLLGGEYEENPQAVPATEDEKLFAEGVLEAVALATGLEVPLYGRIDTVQSARFGLVLLEAELFEPALNLHVVPEATPLLADAILARLPR